MASTYAGVYQGQFASAAGVPIVGASFLVVPPTTQVVTGVTAASTTVTVTVGSTVPFTVGGSIVVAGITGFTNNPNGTFTVASIIDATHLTFVAGTAPTGAYVSGGTVTGNVAATIYSDGNRTAMTNPLPLAVSPGQPGVDGEGNVVFFADSLVAYDIIVTGAGGVIYTPFRVRMIPDPRVLPLPTGTPTAGQTPVVSTVTPLALVWGAGGGGTPTPESIIASTPSNANLDVTAFNAFEITLTANVTFTFINIPTNKVTRIMVRITQGGVGGFIPTFSPTPIWSYQTSPPLNATVGLTDVFEFVFSNAGAVLSGFLAGQAMG
jgi:hypothetical protein